MTWKIEYATSVRKLDKQVQRRIHDILELRLAETEDPRQLASPPRVTRYRNLWRYRVGDYHIIASDCRIPIVRIAQRRQACRS